MPKLGKKFSFPLPLFRPSNLGPGDCLLSSQWEIANSQNRLRRKPVSTPINQKSLLSSGTMWISARTCPGHGSIYQQLQHRRFPNWNIPCNKVKHRAADCHNPHTALEIIPCALSLRHPQGPGDILLPPSTPSVATSLKQEKCNTQLEFWQLGSQSWTKKASTSGTDNNSLWNCRETPSEHPITNDFFFLVVRFRAFLSSQSSLFYYFFPLTCAIIPPGQGWVQLLAQPQPSDGCIFFRGRVHTDPSV